MWIRVHQRKNILCRILVFIADVPVIGLWIRMGHYYQIFIFALIPKTGINQPNVEIAIAKIVAGLVLSWIIAWTPYSLISLLGISGHTDLLTPLSSMLPALFAKTAACVDPFIYSLNHPKIRQEIIFRLYKCFLQSAVVMGRRDASFNSDIPEWKMSGSARVTRQQLIHQSNAQHGRIAVSLVSSRRVYKSQQATLSGAIGGGGCSTCGNEEKRRNISELSNPESHSVNAERLVSADIITCMMNCNQDCHSGKFRRLLSDSTEMSCKSQISTALAHIHSPIKQNVKTPGLMSTQL